MAENAKHEVEQEPELTAEECFREAAKKLRELNDPVERASQGYGGRGLADSWMELGMAIKGTHRHLHDSILDED